MHSAACLHASVLMPLAPVNREWRSTRSRGLSQPACCMDESISQRPISRHRGRARVCSLPVLRRSAQLGRRDSLRSRRSLYCNTCSLVALAGCSCEAKQGALPAGLLSRDPQASRRAKELKAPSRSVRGERSAQDTNPEATEARAPTPAGGAAPRTTRRQQEGWPRRATPSS